MQAGFVAIVPPVAEIAVAVEQVLLVMLAVAVELDVRERAESIPTVTQHAATTDLRFDVDVRAQGHATLSGSEV